MSRNDLIEKFGNRIFCGSSPQMLAACKSLTGRLELNGVWEDDGNFWCTSHAFRIVNAFTAGWYEALEAVRVAEAEALDKAARETADDRSAKLFIGGLILGRFGSRR